MKKEQIVTCVILSFPSQDCNVIVPVNDIHVIESMNHLNFLLYRPLLYGLISHFMHKNTSKESTSRLQGYTSQNLGELLCLDIN